MILNNSKTKSLLIGTSKRLANSTDNSLKLYLDGNLIEEVSSHWVLGIKIDKNLDFKEQINRICKTISSKLNVLSKIKQYLPISSRQKNYLVPVIDYGSTIWGTAAKTQIERILRLQKRAARIILDKPPDFPSRQLFEDLKWLTIILRSQSNQFLQLPSIILWLHL